jgi:hypothetical protein
MYGQMAVYNHIRHTYDMQLLRLPRSVVLRNVYGLRICEINFILEMKVRFLTERMRNIHNYELKKLCSLPQIPHGLAWNQTRTSAVRD